MNRTFLRLFFMNTGGTAGIRPVEIMPAKPLAELWNLMYTDGWISPNPK
jgi:hypothetical protein